MQEFVIRNIWDHDLIIVAKDYTTASFSFLKYLSEREYQINLKKLAEWSWKNSFLHRFFPLFPSIYAEVPAFA